MYIQILSLIAQIENKIKRIRRIIVYKDINISNEKQITTNNYL